MTSEYSSGKSRSVSTRQEDIRIQRSAADFIANYHSKMPHADVAKLETLFAQVPPKKNKHLDYEELPIDLSYQGVPVHIVRAGATVPDKKKKDFDSILDSETGDTFYLFLGDEKLDAFAQLADNSSEWAAFAPDGVCEPLSKENQLIVNEILNSATNEAQNEYYRKLHEAEMQHRRRVTIGSSIATVAILASIGGGIYTFFHLKDVRARDAANAYDEKWGNRDLDATPVIATDYTIHNVDVVPFDQYLADAPTYEDSPKAGVPRAESVELVTGGCAYADVQLSPTDTVTAVQLKYSEVNPIGMVVDNVNDWVKFCSFAGSSTQKYPVYTNVIFEVTKNGAKK